MFILNPPIDEKPLEVAIFSNRQGALVVRILIVSQYFHPENFRINPLAFSLRDRGHEVVVLTGQPNYPAGSYFPGYGFFRPTRERVDGIEVVRVPLIPRGRGGAVRLIINYLSFVFFALSFGLPRLKGSFDVTIAWCSSPITSAIPALVYRMFTRTPTAIWVQDLWPETFFAVTKSRNRILQAVLHHLVRWIYRHCDQVWMQSPAYRESMLRHGARGEQLVDVPNWAEDFYDADTWADIIPDVLPANSLVFAGNLGRAQGLETLIEAAQMTHAMKLPVHWIFLGDGSLLPWLKEQVRSRNLESHVQLLPRRPAIEVPKILKAAAATLIALGDEQVYAQTIPSKVQSCLASKKPVIGTLFGAPAQVIRDAKCGILVKPGDARSLANAVQEFLGLSMQAREELGENAHRAYRAHFQQSKVVSEIEIHLREMAVAKLVSNGTRE